MSQAEARPDQPLYTLLDSGGDEQESHSYGDCAASAQDLARVLARRTERGDRVLILAVGTWGFLRSFLAVQFAGAIAVPVYPPIAQGASRSAEVLGAIVADCRPRLIVSDVPAEIEASYRASVPELNGIEWVACDEGESGGSPLPPVGVDDVSFLQYTSGSTGSPKGVIVTHGALLEQQEMLRLHMRTRQDDVGVGWLPLFHDMGLIGNVLHPLFVGFHVALMSPLAFIQRPRLWLEAISRYAATISGGPNFSYELCVRRVPPEQRQGLDLSSWRVAFNGAEPISPSTLRVFEEAFGATGFRRSTWLPCYGLAEATLLATGTETDAEPLLLRVDASALEQGRATAGADRLLVSSGRPRHHRRLAIVDPDSQVRLPEGSVGEIWLQGRDVAGGYWGRPEESAAVFAASPAGESATYLKTGDLGFVWDGELFVTGRLKDLIVVAGKNHYPQDVEATVEGCAPAVRRGCCAAFAIEGDEGERVGILAGLKKASPPAQVAELAERIRREVARAHGVPVSGVVLVAAEEIPKTSSGKIRRNACREEFKRLGAGLLAAGEAL